jgi:ABC-type phosphate transport system permease subunit
MKNFRQNRKGLLNYFVVVIMAIVIVGVMWFFFANGIQAIQNAFNPMLSSEKFATSGNFDTFNLANTFVNAIIGFFLVFMVLGLAYYGYVESQRRR